jgi:tetratricopeptide (TPR) repeat protein
LTRPSVPDATPALFQQALEHHQAGRLPEAVEAYGRVLDLDPDHLGAYVNRGAALRRLGQPDAALASYDAAIARDPGFTPAHSNRGNLLQELGRFDEARLALETACAQDPADAAAQNNLGNALLGQALPEAALARFDAALAIRPDYASAHTNRGLALALLRRPQEALASFDRALALAPPDAVTLSGRGQALLDLQRPDEALPCLEAAVARDPRNPVARMRLGHAQTHLGRPDQALASYEAAAALAPGSADAIFNRGLALLALDRFEEGWRDYEFRLATEDFAREAAGLVSADLRAAMGPAPDLAQIAGRSLLVVAEQGLGDTVMFASMLPDLIETAGPVTLLCPPRLTRLFAASFPAVRIAPLGADADLARSVDHVLAIGSLGRLFRNRPDSFPKRPYLTASPATLARWAERLGPPRTRLRVGLAWRGGVPQTGGRDRSIALTDLRPLLELPDCEFVSLQHGDPEKEIAAMNATLARPIRAVSPQDIDNFEDLAALTQSLDLVVTVQTALVHVAGAVGAPTLAMTRRVVPFRYGRSAPTMPWYGSVRLIRQDESGTWAPVIREVATRLSQPMEAWTLPR